MDSFDALSTLMKKMPANVFLVPSKEELDGGGPRDGQALSAHRSTHRTTATLTPLRVHYQETHQDDGSVRTYHSGKSGSNSNNSNKRSQIKRTVMDTHRLKGTSVEVRQIILPVS
jgi:hypothetical protein